MRRTRSAVSPPLACGSAAAVRMSASSVDSREASASVTVVSAVAGRCGSGAVIGQPASQAAARTAIAATAPVSAPASMPDRDDGGSDGCGVASGDDAVSDGGASASGSLFTSEASSSMVGGSRLRRASGEGAASAAGSGVSLSFPTGTP